MSEVQLTADNENHVYTVENVDGNFQSVFPEPMAALSFPHVTEAGAYCYLLNQKIATDGGDQWKFENPAYAARKICEDLLSILGRGDDQTITIDWMFNESGTPVSEVWKTLEMEIWSTDGEDGELAATNDQLRVAKDLWADLGNVPVNDDEKETIDEDWLLFVKGTPRIEIWHWFEETFYVSVAKDLMGLH
jgi:hypothetical protein